MNWYKYIKKADQPLPSYEGVSDEVWEQWTNYDYLGPPGVEERLTKNVAQKELKKFPDLCYLGSGNCGVAYSSGNIVVKYTKESDEYIAARTLMDLQKDGAVEGFVEVYDVITIAGTGKYDAVYRITLEKVIPLTEKDEEMAYVATYLFYKGYRCENVEREIDENLVTEMISTLQQGVHNPYTGKQIKFNPSRQKVRDSIYNWCKLRGKLQMTGASTSDLMGHNIGINPRNEWVLLDIGMAF